MLAASLGRDDDARTHLERAATLAEAIDAPLLLARPRARQCGRLRLGPALDAPDGVAEAREHVAGA